MKKYVFQYKYTIILFILFILGFFATFSYGKYWDEPTEQRILYMNIKEYVIQLFPEESAIYQDYNENPFPPISLNKEKDHGVAAYYLVHPFLQTNISEIHKMYIWHLHTYFIFFLGVLSLYYSMFYISQKKWLAIMTTFMYFFTPRIFAHGHYNNKDMVELSLFLVLLALFFSLLNQVKWWKIILASLVVAILVNTKIIGICLTGMLVLMYFILALIKKESPKNIISVLSGGLICSILFFYLLTPAMWNSPLEYFIYNLENSTAFQRWDGYIRFLGTDYHISSLPIYYLVVMIISTTPIYILVCAGIGHIALLFKLIKEKHRFFLCPQNVIMTVMFITWFMPVSYAVLSSMPLYNGWRHLFFIYGSFVILSGYGVEQLFTWIDSRNLYKTKTLTATLLALCVFCSIIGIAINHPYEYAYYNILARKNADTRFEMDYWNLSTKDAIEKVTNIEDNTVTISAFDYYSLNGLKKAATIVQNPQSIKVLTDYETDWKSSDYLIVNITYAQIYANELYEQVKKDFQLVDTIKSYGNTLIEIYQPN